MTRITHESVVDRQDGGTYHLMSTLDNATHALDTHQERIAEIAARAENGDPLAAERLNVLGDAIGRLIESAQAIQDQGTI
ncbi:hypothetical protein KA047_03970 [Candidatus Saccharibacteria bacterium]|nr:hypothetical protein [Candidatus Saccharibacteria bacterium]